MRVKLGLSYVAQGRLGDAARAFETALEANPTLVEALDGLGRVYATTGLYTEAIEQWQAVLRVAPDHSRAQALIRMARKEMAAAKP